MKDSQALDCRVSCLCVHVVDLLSFCKKVFTHWIALINSMACLSTTFFCVSLCVIVSRRRIIFIPFLTNADMDGGNKTMPPLVIALYRYTEQICVTGW